MNLYNLIKHIEEVAKAQPGMGSCFTGDIYNLNHYQDLSYPAFVSTQRQHRVETNSEFNTWNLVLFVVDRLTESKDNRLQVQSYAIQCLQDILKTLEQLPISLGSYTINTFEERFNDVCAGAFLEVSISTPLSECGDSNFLHFITLEDLTDIKIVKNGTYTAPVGYKTVEVEVPGPDYEQIDEVLTSDNPELHREGSFDKVDVVVEGDKLEKELTPRATSFKDNTKIYTDVDVKIKTQPTLKMRRNNETLSMKMVGAFPETLEIDVPTQEITLTQNGTWESPKDYNYAHKVTVNVPDPVHPEFYDTISYTNRNITQEGSYTGINIDSDVFDLTEDECTLTPENPEWTRPINREDALIGDIHPKVAYNEGWAIALNPKRQYFYYDDPDKFIKNIDVDVDYTDLTATQNNKTYKSDDYFYVSVHVNIPTQEVVIKENGVYESDPDKNYFRKVTVDTIDPEQDWYLIFKDYKGDVIEEKWVKNGAEIPYPTIPPTPTKFGRTFTFSGFDSHATHATDEALLYNGYKREFVFNAVPTAATLLTFKPSQSDRTVEICLEITDNSEIEIWWGDSIITETVSGPGVVRKTHTYISFESGGEAEYTVAIIGAPNSYNLACSDGKGGLSRNCASICWNGQRTTLLPLPSNSATITWCGMDTHKSIKHISFGFTPIQTTSYAFYTFDNIESLTIPEGSQLIAYIASFSLRHLQIHPCQNYGGSLHVYDCYALEVLDMSRITYPAKTNGCGVSYSAPKHIIWPKTEFRYAQFQSLYGVKRLDVPDVVTSLYSSSAPQTGGNSALEVINFGNTRTTVVALPQTATFTQPNSTDKIWIVVPDALVNTWKQSTNWNVSQIAPRIIGYSVAKNKGII